MTGGDLDPRAVLATLGIADAGAIAPVSGGRDTAIYRVERGETAYALRVFRPGQRRVAQSEVRAMRSASEGGVPVPAVLAEGIHDGRPALLLDWCAGQTVADALMHHPHRATSLGMVCGETLARIHGITAPSGWQDDSWLRWSGLDTHDPLYQPLVAVAQRDRLLHLDFHPLNILTDGERVTAVLDWANARPGDPRADLARAISIIRLDVVDLLPEAYPILRAWERGLRTGYANAAGPLAEMPLFHTWAGRAMLHDIAARLATNPAQADRIRRWIALWEKLAARSGSR